MNKTKTLFTSFRHCCSMLKVVLLVSPYIFPMMQCTKAMVNRCIFLFWPTVLIWGCRVLILWVSKLRPFRFKQRPLLCTPPTLRSNHPDWREVGGIFSATKEGETKVALQHGPERPVKIKACVNHPDAELISMQLQAEVCVALMASFFCLTPNPALHSKSTAIKLSPRLHSLNPTLFWKTQCFTKLFKMKTSITLLFLFTCTV